METVYLSPDGRLLLSTLAFCRLPERRHVVDKKGGSPVAYLFAGDLYVGKVPPPNATGMQRRSLRTLIKEFVISVGVTILVFGAALFVAEAARSVLNPARSPRGWTVAGVFLVSAVALTIFATPPVRLTPNAFTKGMADRQ